MLAAPPQPTGEGSLGAEIISSQTSIVNLQQDAGVVHRGCEDLGRWESSQTTGLGKLSPDQSSEMGLPVWGPGSGCLLQEGSLPTQPLLTVL